MSDPRVLLADRLQLHSSEIRQTMLDRLHAMAGDEGVRDIEYLRGLDAAVSSGVEYGLEIVMFGGAQPPRIPMPVLTQARLAARHRIPLKLVLHRYLAARSVLNDFVLKSASELPNIDPPVLHAVLEAHNAVFDELVPAISDEYEREESARRSTSRSQHADLIQRLLHGKASDGSSLQYDFDKCHLGLVVLSPVPSSLLRDLSKEVDARLLMTKASDSTTWAWLGGDAPPDPTAVCRWAGKHWPQSVPLGIGEVARSLSGWRRTHNQAQAAASVAHLNSQGIARYRDVALLSAAWRDPLLRASLHDLYLAPLAQQGDRGELLRATLRAFFDADRNGTCAAAALGVSRQTVSNRIQVVEKHLRQPIAACGDLLHAALQLDECGALPLLDNR